jgi:Transcriptional activator of glycolytic enzymes
MTCVLHSQQPALQEQGFGGGAGIPAGEAAAALVNEHGRVRPNAVLCKGPKSIHDLWREYQHGIGNNMPAKNFNGKEHGRAKSAYSQRNLVWTVIVDLVTPGFDADIACDKIYQAYGHNKSVTYIINKMYKDKRAAGGKDAIGESWKQPNLRVGT